MRPLTDLLAPLARSKPSMPVCAGRGIQSTLRASVNLQPPPTPSIRIPQRYFADGADNNELPQHQPSEQAVSHTTMEDFGSSSKRRTEWPCGHEKIRGYRARQHVQSDSKIGTVKTAAIAMRRRWSVSSILASNRHSIRRGLIPLLLSLRPQRRARAEARDTADLDAITHARRRYEAQTAHLGGYATKLP